ncbi:hypothetical protein MKX01_032599 [Papaver californicum]|nr:hypothetical protein MKX01_032599 [Papaver californicum]
MDEYYETQVSADNHQYQHEGAMVTMERANNYDDYNNNQELVADHQDDYFRDYYHHDVPASELPPPAAAGLEYNNQQLVPSGFVFAPSDQEALFYLKMKIEDPTIPFEFPFIPEAGVYEHHPQQLLKGIKEQLAYFFTLRTKRYVNGKRPTRTVPGHGYWRMSTKTEPVNAGNMQQVGEKSGLVFHTGRPSENKTITKTNWLMKEYHITDNEWTLCKIYLNKP